MKCTYSLVHFDRKTLIGCDQDLGFFKSILCFMVISLTKSIPFVASAVPIIRISWNLVHSNLDKCISVLSQTDFNLCAILADNHTTNVNAFKQLRHLNGIGNNTQVIRNPYCSGYFQLYFTLSTQIYIILKLHNPIATISYPN